MECGEIVYGKRPPLRLKSCLFGELCGAIVQD